MTRRPKDIGTEAERMVREWLKANGWPETERQVLHGGKDQGDLLICRAPRIIAEVKGGARAEAASATMIGAWLDETETEAVHAGADLAVLVVRRFRRPPALWDAYMRANDWALLLTGDSILPTDAPWLLRASLADWSRMAWEWADVA